jgi:dienelactone hydrolase
MKQRFSRTQDRCSGFLKIFHKSLFIFLITFCDASAQNELDVIRNSWLQFSDARNSLNHHLTGEAFRMLDSREEAISKLRTVNDWQLRQSSVRRILWDIAGSFPEKTPLNARITGKVKKNGYTIENVIYESLPGFYVTASLFIPDKIKKPAPAILFCSGHSTGVYRLPSYQLPLLNLVKKGFVVLGIDPIGQGERLQYFDPVKGESVIGGSTKEHSYPSPQVFLIGKSVARYFIWDGIRGIDYLISRKEVDSKRIGVHGLSGGGTQTAYISAFDDRVAASAPAGYITSYRRLMESVGVQDGEQNFYHGISGGIDHADFIEVRAPKPTLIMATTSDFFSIQGARETYQEVKRLYELFGKPENIEITEDDHGHGYTKKNREAMYAFFQKHLQLPGSSAEEEVDHPSAQELQKTVTGQLSTSLGGETVFSLNRSETEMTVSARLAAIKQFAANKSNMISSAKKLSGFKEPSTADLPVFTGRFKKEDYVVEKYYIKGEGDYVIPYLLFLPDVRNGKGIMYLHPSGKSAGASGGGEIEWFVKKGFVVLAPDLPGVGELGPADFKGDAYISNISYNVWYTSMLIGRSIVGVQASDAVKMVWLLRRAIGGGELLAVARKEMCPVLLHAAAFNPDIAGIAIIEPFSSYLSVAMNRYYKPDFVFGLVPGALRVYDLPDLAASLAPRKLTIAGMTDGNGNSSDFVTINREYNIVRSVYSGANAEGKLSIQTVSDSKSPSELYEDWIE